MEIILELKCSKLLVTVASSYIITCTKQSYGRISGFFQKELQIVFSIAFSTCGHINCDIIQM